MSAVPAEVHAFLRRQPPEVRAGGPGVVAVSGGPDSVALLRAVAAEGEGRRPVVVAHLNHRLRGAESDADEAFVRRLAEELGVPFRCAAVDVAAEAARRGENLEQVAREERYAWLARVAAEEGAGWVATGHTADDQAETVLHRLLRGTGLRGLRGIAARRELRPGIWLLRPLLHLGRADVLAYLGALGQDYRRDSSNLDPRFTRNRIRSELLPLLRTFNPDVTRALARLADQAAEAHTLLEGHTQALLRAAEVPAPPGARALNRRALAGVSRFLLCELFRALWRREGWPTGRMGYRDWDRLAGLALGEGRVIDLPGPVRARRRRHLILLEPLRPMPQTPHAGTL